MDRTGFWVRTAFHFAYAVGYPTKIGDQIKCKSFIGKTLSQALEKLTGDNKEKTLDILGSYLALAGEITTQGEWLIQNSTNPELVGCNLVGAIDTTGTTTSELCCSQLVKEIDGSLQQTIPTTNGPLQRQWKIVELSDESSLPLSTKPPSTTGTSLVFGMDPHPDFVNLDLPRSVRLSSFSLTKLSPDQVDEDFDAVTSSVQDLKGLFGNHQHRRHQHHPKNTHKKGGTLIQPRQPHD